jgi:hypothetical protein
MKHGEKMQESTKKKISDSQKKKWKDKFEKKSQKKYDMKKEERRSIIYFRISMICAGTCFGIIISIILLFIYPHFPTIVISLGITAFSYFLFFVILFGKSLRCWPYPYIKDPRR